CVRLSKLLVEPNLTACTHTETLGGLSRIIENHLGVDIDLDALPFTVDCMPDGRLVFLRNEDATLPEKWILRLRHGHERQPENIPAHRIRGRATQTPQRNEIHGHVPH